MTDDSRRGRLLSIAGGVAFAAATIGLYAVSRGKWSDALIDSGREWIVPDALARGELLYRDVVYWFGPFTPYFHAAFFELLGSSFRTLVIAGVVGSLGALAALYVALRTVTGKREAALWTALAVPTLVFMPNAGGSILGMGYRMWHAATFALVAIGVASRPGAERRPLLRAASVGAFCAFAGLCRTEWGLVAAAAAFSAFLFWERSGRARLRGALVAGSVFFLFFGGSMAAFIAAAGWKAVVEDGHVLLTGLPPETRTFLVEFSGILEWPNGTLELFRSAAMWAGVLLLLQILAIGRSNRSRALRKLPLLATLLLLLVFSGSIGRAGGPVLFSAAPLVCLSAAVLAVARPTPFSSGLFGFGLAGFLFSYRRPFHIDDAAYVGPPLLLALVCAAGLVQRLLDREPDSGTRERLRAFSGAAVLLLVALAFAGRVLQYRKDDRIPIPGTQGMLSARSELVARFEALARTVRRESPNDEGLAVFPEGEILNYLTGRPNPIRHKLYIPGYLTNENEPEVLAELERSPPRVIVVLHRPTPEYGTSLFGVTYGKRIRAWVEKNYDVRRFDVRDRFTRMGSWEAVAIRKEPLQKRAAIGLSALDGECANGSSLFQPRVVIRPGVPALLRPETRSRTADPPR